MSTAAVPDAALALFIARWRTSSAAERANYVLFVTELCELLDLARPNAQTGDSGADAFVFEKPVPLPHGTVGRMDLYRRGCFVLEAKQGSDADEKPGFPGPAQPRKKGTAVRGTATWDVAMERARRQAETSRHRFFTFLDQAILPDNKLIAIALDDAYFLGVLSSRIHVTWALAAGSWLGVGNDPVYVKTMF